MKNKLSLPYREFRDNGRTLVKLTLNNRYFIKDQLGSGRYGRIFKALDLAQNRVVIVKLLDIHALEESTISEDKKALKRRYIEQEDKLMRKFVHPNILPCLDSFSNQDFKIIVTPFCDEGTLFEQLEAAGGSFDEKLAIEIIKQLAHAVAEMHSKSVIHRDLKMENIFKKEGYYLIGDFGLSKTLNEKAGSHTLVGSGYTRAPEVQTRTYDFKADIWSLGVIFFFMLSQENQIERKLKEMQKYLKSSSLIIPKTTEKLSHWTIDFLNKSIVKDPAKRMGWKQMKNHPLFTKIKSQNPILETYFVIPQNTQFQVQEEEIQPIKTQIMTCSTLDLLRGLQSENNEINLIPSIQSLVNDPTSQFYGQVNQIQMKYVLNKNKQNQIFQKFKELYRGVMLAKYIYDELVIPIEDNELLNLQKKKNVELMYLLTARCFFNMSYMQEQLKKPSAKKLNDIFDQFPRMECELLYGQCVEKFHSYGKKLTEFQKKIFEIVKSKLSSSYEEQTYKRFFTGIESVDYKYQEQIIFTLSYIQNIEHLKTKNRNLEKNILNAMDKYYEINQIGLQELEIVGFSRAVKRRLS